MVIAIPVIAVIDNINFAFQHDPSTQPQIGGFTNHFEFDWHAVPERIQRNRTSFTDPLETPTMAGGLFSITKETFNRLGKYDDGMEIWGGENIEMSLRSWMCGARLEIIPCSVIGQELNITIARMQKVLELYTVSYQNYRQYTNGQYNG